MKKASAQVRFLVPMALMLSVVFSQPVDVPNLADLTTKFDERVKLDVLRPHELAVSDLNAKFVAALDKSQEVAQKSGKLEEAIAIKAEKDAVQAGNYAPARDDPKTPAGLKTMRNTYRTALARLELERDKKLRPLRETFANSLESLVLTMIKQGRLEEAVTVKKIREDLLANVAFSKIPQAGENQTSGSGEKNFTNSLGMKFVPVAGTNVLFCIHETRYKDYSAYAAESSDVDSSWTEQSADGVTIKDRAGDHPVWKVNWEDAKKFCAWLSKKEGKAYRLPTDREWSWAAGIGRDEKWLKDTTPATVFKNQIQFPWGNNWPPPMGAGNYSDQSRKEKASNTGQLYIEGYDDGFPTTSPVMNYKPNKVGLYDLGGNVWEWCEDYFDESQEIHVLRGGSWRHSTRTDILSSNRGQFKQGSRSTREGFRCVLEITP